MKKFLVIQLYETQTVCAEIHEGTSIDDVITSSWNENEDFCDIADFLEIEDDEKPKSFCRKVRAYVKENPDGDTVFKIYDITTDEPFEVS